MDTMSSTLNAPLDEQTFDEAEEYGMKIGMAKVEEKHTLMIYRKGYTPSQISDLINIPIERVVYILNDHGFHERNR